MHVAFLLTCCCKIVASKSISTLQVIIALVCIILCTLSNCFAMNPLESKTNPNASSQPTKRLDAPFHSSVPMSNMIAGFSTFGCVFVNDRSLCSFVYVLC